jgi:hypothetical protein
MGTEYVNGNDINNYQVDIESLMVRVHLFTINVGFLG